MLKLAYPIEDTAEIDGKIYNLDLSFDNVLRLLDMLNDDDLNDITQIRVGLEMLLGVCFICDMQTQEKIFYEIFKNTIGVNSEKHQRVDLEGNPLPQKKQDKVLSFKEDSNYIFASFYQDYGIDLIEQQGKLHYYKFLALLDGLRSDTRIKEIINIRTMEMPTGKGTQKQREQMSRLKEHYKLKDDE